MIGPGVSQEDVDERGTGSYVWEDHFYPEVVDRDTGEPLPEGRPGVLIFTTLTKEAMPVIRYRPYHADHRCPSGHYPAQ